MAKYARRSLYLAAETNYAESPRQADSGYVAMPAANTLTASGGPTTLTSARFTGRTGTAPFTAGQTEGAGSFGLDVLGLAAQGGDGDNPSAADHLDLVLSGVAAGTAIERAGENVVGLTGTPATALELDSDIFDAEDLVALTDANGNIRWAAIATDNADGTYVLDFEPQVSGSAIAPTVTLPIRQWVDDDGGDTSKTFSGILYWDTFVRELPGTRVSSLGIEFTAAQLAAMTIGFESDDYKIPPVTPSFTTGTNGDPATVASTEKKTGCIYVDGVQYATAALSVDFGIETADRSSTCSESGRINKLQQAVTPVVTMTTPFLDAWETLNANKGVRDIKVVSGLSSGSVCLHIPNAQLTANPEATDTNGELDMALTWTCVTVGAERRWQIARV